MEYAQACRRLRDALTFGIDPSLEPIRALCRQLDDPQHRYDCIQIAGTNGKSSTARFAAALLRSQGLRVGLYTSPELIRYPERMEIDGEVVGDAAFADAVDAACAAAEAAGIAEPTEFELLTAAALWLFAREQVDVAVLEVGLGGRWDATSVVDPAVCAITSVAFDHTAVLGDTLEEIAAEKAAVITPGTTVVLAPDLAAKQVFCERIGAVGARCVDLDADTEGSGYLARARMIAEAHPGLARYQIPNVATALATAEAYLSRPIADAAAVDAVGGLRLPGRFEILREDPLLVIDSAHNPASAAVLAAETRRLCGEDVPVLLLGVLADKDARGIVEALADTFESIVVCTPPSDRALSAEDLATIVSEVCGRSPRIVPDIAEALDLLGDTALLASGSITVAGEVARLWC
ncbi:MAG: bifunctional folylpolyglutamate synthase/dihydrofolate synthase [Coriobacteriaceae bacterium]|nr:bifunctional folylpolyglutamate synthase/dihydrofolate synthase [Coriobacteriaceae bacterium]